MGRHSMAAVAAAILICLPGATLGWADDVTPTDTSRELGVSPTGAIGPKGAVVPKTVLPPALPKTPAALPPVTIPEGAVHPQPLPAYPTFEGFYDEETTPVEPPVEGEMPPVVDEAAPEVIVEEPIVEAPSAFEVIPAPVPTPGPVLRRTNPESCDPDCGQRRDDCCWPIDDCGTRYGRTTITLEGSFGLLNDMDGKLGTPAFGFARQFEWDELDYSFSVGGRVTLEHAIQPQQWIQFRGAYYGSWDDSTSRVGVFGFQPGNTFTGGGTQRVGASNDVNGTLSGDAELFGAEFNYINEISCSGCSRLDFIVGVRYLQFDETARADFAEAPITGFTGPAFVASSVENTFVGLQAGIRWHYQPSNALELTAGLKALAGNVNRNITVSDQSIFAGGPHTATDEEDEIVLGADIELGIRVRLTRCIAVTAGYNLIVLDSVSRANDVMDFSQSGSGAVQAQQVTDQLIWHGVFAGLQFNF